MTTTTADAAPSEAVQPASSSRKAKDLLFRLALLACLGISIVDDVHSNSHVGHEQHLALVAEHAATVVNDAVSGEFILPEAIGERLHVLLRMLRRSNATGSGSGEQPTSVNGAVA